ncbi:MAG: sigma-E processing peptidase SpoIIGA [Clostridia bacterium]|nr:sigma-E processing peptidase SpoIIGA [Clostridia bacterium]
MMMYILIFVISITLDLFSTFFVSKIMNLKVPLFELFFSQIFYIIALTLFLFCGLQIYVFLIIKFFMTFAVAFLITDDYHFKKIIKISLILFASLMMIYGFWIFFDMFTKAVIYELFGKNLDYLNHIFVFFAEILFIFLIFISTKSVSNFADITKRKLKVSFCIFGKHILVTGLIDSGNMLYNGLEPVLILKKSIVNELISESIYQNLKRIRCVGVDEMQFEIPVISSVEVEFEGSKKICSIGLVNYDFGKKFDCLIHRDCV